MQQEFSVAHSVSLGRNRLEKRKEEENIREKDKLCYMKCTMYFFMDSFSNTFSYTISYNAQSIIGNHLSLTTNTITTKI